MKRNILDVTFNIPIRIDSAERLRNLRIAIKFIQKYFYANIIIGESSPEPTLKSLGKECGYIHYKSDSITFHRTKILNDLARATPTIFLVNYDADVLVNPDQIIKSVQLLRGGSIDLVLPYGGSAKDILPHKVNDIEQTLNIHTLREKDLFEMNPEAYGGAVFWNKYSFMKAGMENENFIDWGCEDNERLVRIQKLGMKAMRVPGTLYHLHHSRKEKDNFGQKHYGDNTKELRKIEKMTKMDLEQYIKTWSWV